MSMPAQAADPQLDASFEQALEAIRDTHSKALKENEATAQASVASLGTSPTGGERAAAEEDFAPIHEMYQLICRELGIAPAGQGRSQSAGSAQPDVDGSATPVLKASAGPVKPLPISLSVADGHDVRYEGSQEWQRIGAIRTAFRGLVTEIKNAAGSYYQEWAADVRGQGFMAQISSRACNVISHSAGVLAWKLDKAGLRATPAWQGAWDLHRTTANYASQLAGRIPRGYSADPVGDMRTIFETLGARLAGPRASDSKPLFSLAAVAFPRPPSKRITATPAANGMTRQRGPAADLIPAQAAQSER